MEQRSPCQTLEIASGAVEDRGIAQPGCELGCGVFEELAVPNFDRAAEKRSGLHLQGVAASFENEGSEEEGIDVPLHHDGALQGDRRRSHAAPKISDRIAEGVAL